MKRRMKRTKPVRLLWICRRCFEIKHLRSRGMCYTCYEIQYQVDIRARKDKAERKAADTHIAPVKIMNMKVEQIVREWSKILRGAGF